MRKETFFNERRPSRWLALGLVTGFFLSMAMPQVRAASATLSTAPLFDSNWSVISVTASNEVCAANGQANGCAAVPGCVPVFTKNASTGIAWTIGMSSNSAIGMPLGCPLTRSVTGTTKR